MDVIDELKFLGKCKKKLGGGRGVGGGRGEGSGWGGQDGCDRRIEVLGKFTIFFFFFFFFLGGGGRLVDVNKELKFL